MLIYLIRHAKADHLTENWSKGRIGRDSFIEKMSAWNSVPLTEDGITEAHTLSHSMPKSYQCMFCSPLPRAIQTAEIINIAQKKIIYLDDLKEIITSPPCFLAKMRFTILIWIYLCIIWGVFNGDVIRVIRMAKEIFKVLLEQNDDITVVSHSMRIRSLILYARFCPSLKILKTDYTTCGMSIVRKKHVELKVTEVSPQTAGCP